MPDIGEALSALATGYSRGLSKRRQAEQQFAMETKRDMYKELLKNQLREKLYPEEAALKKSQTEANLARAEYYRQPRSVFTKTTTPGIVQTDSTPEGYQIGYDRKGGRILEKIKQPSQPKISETEKFREALRSAKQAIRTGESSVDEEVSILQDIYPEKDFSTQKIMWKSLVPKKQIEKKPIFSGVKETASNIGKGFMGLFSKPDIQNKVQKARSAGYTDEEIAAYLKGK